MGERRLARLGEEYDVRVERRFLETLQETGTGAPVRVCVGPEFGTLGDADISNAAIEAMKGTKCDLLLVCAFFWVARRDWRAIGVRAG